MAKVNLVGNSVQVLSTNFGGYTSIWTMRCIQVYTLCSDKSHGYSMFGIECDASYQQRNTDFIVKWLGLISGILCMHMLAVLVLITFLKMG